MLMWGTCGTGRGARVARVQQSGARRRRRRLRSSSIDNLQNNQRWVETP